MKSHRRGRVVTLALVFGLAATAVLAGSAPAMVGDGIAYSEAEHLSGVYFTNFENSTFVECDRSTGGCRNWAGSPERYGLHCVPVTCVALEAKVKALNDSHDRWGLFAIHFTGRKSIGPGKSRWLGDPPRKVLIEHIESLDLLEAK